MTERYNSPLRTWLFRGWCDECEDGLKSNARTEIAEWTATHNHKKTTKGIKS